MPRKVAKSKPDKPAAPPWPPNGPMPRTPIADIVRKWIVFDNQQQHRHTWHDLQNCLIEVTQAEFDLRSDLVDLRRVREWLALEGENRKLAGVYFTAGPERELASLLESLFHELAARDESVERLNDRVDILREMADNALDEAKAAVQVQMAELRKELSEARILLRGAELVGNFIHGASIEFNRDGNFEVIYPPPESSDAHVAGPKIEDAWRMLAEWEKRNRVEVQND